MAQPAKGHFKDYYDLKEKLGKGAYAVVYSCKNKKTGEEYAVKVVDKTKAGPKDIDDLAHEINIMDQIGYHPNVVQMIEWFSTERHLYIVMDLLSGGMLFDRIVQMRHYSEANASALTRNFLSALAHIHSKNIIHRDLKPENLLLRTAPTSANDTDTSHLVDVCLADFGLAGYVPSETCCGSPSYIAPEVINVGYFRTGGKSYNEKCDIWSLGVITYILISGKMPFHGANFKETFSRIVAGKWDFVGDIWKQVTPKCTEFIRLCLSQDPAKRPSANELLKHPWVAESQPDVHLQESLEGLKKFNAQAKIRAAVRVFCWTQSLLGKSLDRTPPFMRYLRHEDIYSTVVVHQSQTDPNAVHVVDYSKALDHEKPGWRMQDCCTCPSELVCRHIQNVHEYLFVGKRSMEVFPFINELKMMKAEAEADIDENPKNKDALEKLKKVEYSINAACVFSDCLAEVPHEQLKPNLMLDGSRNDAFRARGGSRSAVMENDAQKEAVAGKLAERFRARKAAQQQQQGGAGGSAPAAATTASKPPTATASSSSKAAASSKGPEPPRKVGDNSSSSSKKTSGDTKEKKTTSKKC